jgi:para-nitrobenzyl esterase
MKKILLAAFSVLAIFSVKAQGLCDEGRYVTEDYFDSVVVTSNIQFGSNIEVGGGGQQQALFLDLFEPFGDTLANRPIILFTFGGSFVGGQRSDVHFLCEYFARRGYVTAAVDYRVGIFFPINERSTTLAVVRGMHDMKAAVRFFYKDAATANEYGIDTNRIVVGGISAGAISAIHAAYLDKTSEIPAYLVADTAAFGGIEGLSGNLGYSSRVHGVISYSGTIGDTSWIEAGSAPIIMFHDTSDATVPFGSDTINALGINTGLVADGSRSMQIRCDNVGVANDFLWFNRSGHVAYFNATDRDTVLRRTAQNTAVVACRELQTGIFDAPDFTGSFNLYPNPSNGSFIIEISGNNQPVTVGVYNMVGQLVSEIALGTNQQQLVDLSTSQSGIYLVRVADATTGALVTTHKLIVQ